MGVYVYCTKPSHLATAEVELIDGSRAIVPVALYRYAYKPGGIGSYAFNQRQRFVSGALACAQAYDRSGKEVPALGTFFDAEAGEVYAAGRNDANGVFKTGGSAEIVDDSTTQAGVIVRWVKLPKGIREGALPLDKRLTPTTVLQFEPRALRENVGRMAYWVRLADTATGEHQPEWTLCQSSEDMDKLAARYGVPVVKAPAA